MLGIIYIRFLQIQIHLYQSRRMKEKAMENVTTHACQSRLESFRIQVIPGKVPNWIWLLSKLKTAPFGVNLPKSFIWSDPKFTEVNGKTPAGFRLNWIRPLPSTMEPLFCGLGAPLQDHHTASARPAKHLSPSETKRQADSRLSPQLVPALQHSFFKLSLEL